MRRVYAHLIAVFFLASCSNQTSTPPRVVKFDDVLAAYIPAEPECEWQEVDVSVFNQKDQRVSFSYNDCSAPYKIKDWTRTSQHNGDAISYTADTKIEITQPSGEVTLREIESKTTHFTINKLGPNTATAYLKAYHENHPLRSDMQCSVIQGESAQWRYEQTADCEPLKRVRFIVKGGLVVRFGNIDASKNIIELSSITYTNKG